MYALLITIIFSSGEVTLSPKTLVDSIQECNQYLSTAHYGAPYDSITIDFVDGLISRKAVTYNPTEYMPTTYIYSCTKELS